MKKIEDKKSIEEQMYGYLPYWELFSQHQGDYLDSRAWLKIVSIIEQGIIKKAKLILEKNNASLFCSCYGGDLYERYNKGVDEFIKELGEKQEITEDIYNKVFSTLALFTFARVEFLLKMKNK